MGSDFEIGNFCKFAPSTITARVRDPRDMLRVEVHVLRLGESWMFFFNGFSRGFAEWSCVKCKLANEESDFNNDSGNGVGVMFRLNFFIYLF